MSHEYRLDLRAAQMTQLNHAIRMAQQHLGAAKAQIACGHAEVTVVGARHLEGAPVQASHLRADMSSLERARHQDKLEVRDSHGLKTRLASTGPNLSASGLGNWKDVPASFEVGDAASPETKGLRRLTELECTALEGAHIAIFEHTDHQGTKTLHFGVDAELQNEKGEWLNAEAKAVFERFQASLSVAQDLALQDDPVMHHEHQSQVDAALELAGLEPVAEQNLEGQRTHTVFSNTESTTGKTHKAGG
jgi:hypothetical protein